MTDRILPYSIIEELWHTYEDFEDFARAIEQAVLQSEQVQAWKRDSERLDFITSKPGVCYALVSDDSGRWALTDTGMSPVAPDQGFTETVGITSIVDPDMWKSSPREAIDAAMEKQP